MKTKRIEHRFMTLYERLKYNRRSNTTGINGWYNPCKSVMESEWHLLLMF